MSTTKIKREVEEQIIRMVVTRADGTVEDLGVVSYFHKNPLKRLAWNINKFFRRFSYDRSHPEQRPR